MDSPPPPPPKEDCQESGRGGDEKQNSKRVFMLYNNTDIAKYRADKEHIRLQVYDI